MTSAQSAGLVEPAAAVRVSIVMPVFNAAGTLRRSIDSVLAQTFTDFELIVVDDASSDDSAAIIAAYAERDERIRSLRQSVNSGVAYARNLALAAARGSHIAFLDSDDRWHPRKLQLQLVQMLQSGARLSCTSYCRVAEDDRVLSFVQPPARVHHADLLRGNSIALSSAMYERSLGDARFREIGHEDYVFWLDLVQRAGSVVCIESDEPLASYLVRSGSVSSNKLRAARWQWQIYRRVVGLGLVESMICMANYAAGALRKRRQGSSQKSMTIPD